MRVAEKIYTFLFLNRKITETISHCVEVSFNIPSQQLNRKKTITFLKFFTLFPKKSGH